MTWRLCITLLLASGCAGASEPHVEHPIEEQPIEPPIEPAEEDAGVAPDAEIAVVSEDAGPIGDQGVQLEDRALSRAGRRAYERYCADCHDDGPRLLGRGIAPSRVRHVVRQGSGRMRAIPATRVSDRDLEAIAAFLRSSAAR